MYLGVISIYMAMDVRGVDEVNWGEIESKIRIELRIEILEEEIVKGR